MKIGKTEVETLRLNGFGVGDILEAEPLTEASDPDRIMITAIGVEKFLCMWDWGTKGTWSKEMGSTTLSIRPWRKVGKFTDQAIGG